MSFWKAFINSRGVIGLLGIFTVGATGQSALSAITGFGDGSNYSLTGYTQANDGTIIDNNPPTISSGTLTITTSSPGEARAAYYNTAQPIGSFVAQFTFQNSDSVFGAGDGFAFVLQNDPRGLTAIGGGGAGLGYGLQNDNQPPSGPPLAAVTNSAAVEFYLRNGLGATEYDTNGGADFGSATSASPVDLVDGDPILVTLTYNGSQLTETLTDELVPADTYTNTFAADLPAAVGGATALVGFTGGTGGGYSTQTISNFTFAPVPEPTSLGLLSACALGLLRRRTRRA
jgi:hypothetical protein